MLIQHAIVLTSDEPTNPYAPHSTRVAGLNLLKRTLVMLQWAGVPEAYVIVGPWDRGASQRSIEGDRDLRDMRIRFLVDEDAAARGGLAVAPAARFVRGRTLVVRADTVYERDIVRNLMKRATGVGHVVAVTDRGRRTGMVLCERGSAAAMNGYTLDVALDAFADQGRLKTMDVAGRFWVPIENDEAIRLAEDLLWNSCRKPIDGVVARHFNRNVSLFISRRIAHLPIRPNHVSLVNFALGILMALAIAKGGYGWFLLGALLFKLNSILDGVDGELARVRYQMSVVGEWMDTLSDDLSNLLFFVSLSVGAYAMTADPLWVTLGFVTVIPSLLATAYQYTLLIRGGRGDLLAIKWLFERGNGKGSEQQGAFASFMDKLKYVVKKDFFVALTVVAALLNALPWVLWLTAIANVILLGTVVAQEVLVRRMRGRGEQVVRLVAGPAPPPEAVVAEARVSTRPAAAQR